MSSTANTTSQDTTIVVKSKLVEILVGQLKTQGFPVILFACAVWYFYLEVKELKHEIRLCQEARVESSEKREAKLIEVISNNTHALERLVREEQWRKLRE